MDISASNSNYFLGNTKELAITIVVVTAKCFVYAFEELIGL